MMLSLQTRLVWDCQPWRSRSAEITVLTLVQFKIRIKHSLSWHSHWRKLGHERSLQWLPFVQKWRMQATLLSQYQRRANVTVMSRYQWRDLSHCNSTLQFKLAASWFWIISNESRRALMFRLIQLNFNLRGITRRSWCRLIHRFKKASLYTNPRPSESR